MNYKIGDLIYRPVVDTVFIGFAIEEITIEKLVGPSNNPYGSSTIIWSYGDISLLKEKREKQKGRKEIYYISRCFNTIEDCITELENKKNQLIQSLNTKKENALEEVVEFKKMLKDLEKENLNTSRFVNKKLSMLKQFNIERDIEKRGLI